MLLLLNSIASALLIKFMGVKTFTESTTFQNGILGEFWLCLSICFDISRAFLRYRFWQASSL